MGLHSGIFTLSVGGGSGEEGGGLDLRFFLGDSWANRVFHAQPQTGAYSCSFSVGNISSYQHQDNAHLKMSLPFTLIPKSFSSLCRREGRALRRGALIVGIPPKLAGGCWLERPREDWSLNYTVRFLFRPHSEYSIFTEAGHTVQGLLGAFSSKAQTLTTEQWQQMV